MKRLLSICAALVVLLTLAPIAAAQAGSVSGQIIAPDGTPWAGVDVFIQNMTNGQHFQVKTDKNGHYTQLGVAGGNYKITIQAPPQANGQRLTYSETHTLNGGTDNDVSINFKKLIEANPEYQKQQEAQKEETGKFAGMKAHFDAGVTAMNDSDTLRKQLAGAPPDQKAGLQDKLKTDYQTAISEFQQAEQGVNPKDTKNHALVLANLGLAQDFAGNYDDAIASYQKAIALEPTPAYYVNLARALSSSAVAQTDPQAAQQKLADAGAACDKATALDPTVTARCYKNLGITLSNKGDMKDAVAPLQKATQADPKDAQAWFLLGSALASEIGMKQQGNELIPIIPPGTTDAFQNAINADPNGPYGVQAKEALDGLKAISGGEKETVRQNR